jgi:hypothetical protein
MAVNDIRALRSPRGGSFEVAGFPLTAAANINEGEPVVVTAGAIVEAATDPVTIQGIAAGRTTDADGTVFAAGTPIPVIQTDAGQQWVCNNFATDGAGTAVVPTQANAIGVLAGLTLAGGVWFVDTGAANLLARIVDVQDAEGRSITDPNQNTGAGMAVIFRFV